MSPKWHYNQADPLCAPFTAVRYKELGLLISAGKAGLLSLLRLTDSEKQCRQSSIIMVLT